ncbi:hypothetical protein ACP70R_028701 [Stipagrostis hirtigluma subsp. patula]
MAASMAKATALLLFVCALHCHAATLAAETGPCSDAGLEISTAATGRVVGGQPEYRVTVDNQCTCPLTDVVLSCPGGLPSMEPVNRTLVHVVGGDGILCLVYNGWPIKKGSPVAFTYAWNATLDFAMDNASPQC